VCIGPCFTTCVGVQLFKGLGAAVSPQNTLMDGMPYSRTWHFAVGAAVTWKGSNRFPGFVHPGVEVSCDHAEVFVWNAGDGTLAPALADCERRFAVVRACSMPMLASAPLMFELAVCQHCCRHMPHRRVQHVQEQRQQVSATHGVRCGHQLRDDGRHRHVRPRVHRRERVRSWQPVGDFGAYTVGP
jgi:hypothetical protein